MDVQRVPIHQRIDKLLTGISQNASWLAERAGVERSTITRILRGERNPTPETLCLIAPVLGVTVEQLVVGTDAEERVEGARKLIDRAHYDDAVRQFIDAEKRATSGEAHIRELKEIVQQEIDRRRKAERQLEIVEHERDEEKRRANTNEHDAQRYKVAFERAFQDVARLQTELQELAAAVDSSKRTGHVAVILAGVAAVASVANYLKNNDTTTA